MPALLLCFFFFFVAFTERRHLLAIAGDCPLDFSWSNFTMAASACTNQNEQANCCRYINAFVAISVARYANATGKLGVPPAFSDTCLDSVSETFQLYGIPADATRSCGLGPKIQVAYQCGGRGTVLEMMQAPGFSNVITSCKVPLSLDTSCKTCLNSGIVYLHHLIGPGDNIALSMCRDAVFVTLVNLRENMSTDDLAACFFGVGGLSSSPDHGPESSLGSATTASSSNLTSAEAPAQKIIGILKKRHPPHPYRLTLIPGMGVGVILVSVVMLLVLVLLIRKKSRELKSVCAPKESWTDFPQARVRRYQEGTPQMFRRYSHREIQNATESFSNIAGKGGFGTVYKARFGNGSVAAVKRMDKVSKQGEEEFCREIDLLARLHHRHLVALKGFCAERNERFLVYEYMANGSLKDHLHSSGRKPLSWETRLQIAIDVANALEYLHFYCDPPLCHRDIKSSNILLDENFVAKVADFGLAHASRTGSISFEPVNTDIRGTPGYMDPEYVVTQELTEKSDVYSYGVLLLELVTGRRAIQDHKNLVEWSSKFMAVDSELPNLVDPKIAGTFSIDQLHLLTGIIQWCTQREGRARPSIKYVLRVLSEGLDPPRFAEGMEDDKGDHCLAAVAAASKCRTQRNELIPHDSDARCLQSSSSTTRSCCSRSVLLGHGSPESPPGLFSL